MGHKASDAFVAFLCFACHSWVDQGSGTREARQGLWEDAHRKSLPLYQHLLGTKGREAMNQ